MPSHLLLFAATGTDQGGFFSAIGKLASEFGVDWPLLIAQIVCFSIVAVLLWKFAFKPVLATMEERQRQIEAGLKFTDEAKAKLAQAQQESAAVMKQAQLEGARLIDDTRKTAKQFLDQQQKETTARANDMIAKAQQAIDSEHKKMLEQARHEVARLVVQTAQQVLAKELTDDERARYNETASRQVKVL